jgi:hypothetical protein
MPIAPVSWTHGGAAPGSRPWRAAADGAGGLWIALPGRLMRLGGASSGLVGPVALSEGDGGAAVAAPAAGGGVVVFRAGSQLGPPIVLRHAGALGVVAEDPVTHAIEVASVARGRVRLTLIGPAGRPGPVLDLPTCRGLHPVQVLSGGGLVAVRCDGDWIEDPSREQTGGEYVASSRHSYVLVRGGRIVVSGVRFSSVDDF